MIPLLRQLVLGEERDIERECAFLLEHNKATCLALSESGDTELLTHCVEAAQKARGHLADFYLAKRENNRSQMVGSMAAFVDECVRVRYRARAYDYGSAGYRRCVSEVTEILLSKQTTGLGLPTESLIAEAEAAREKRLADYEAQQTEAAKARTARASQAAEDANERTYQRLRAKAAQDARDRDVAREYRYAKYAEFDALPGIMDRLYENKAAFSADRWNGRK